MFAEVADFCRERQPFCQNTRSVPEAALFLSDLHLWQNSPQPFCLGDGGQGLEGALRILLENQIPVDVLDESRFLARLEQYPLVVIPEQYPVSTAVVSALTAFVEKGGTAILTGAHLADLCPELTGTEPLEPIRRENWHLQIEKECASLAGPWRPVRAVDARVYALAMKEQEPGKDETLYPAVTVRRFGRGTVAAVHGNFMRTYYYSNHPRLRRFMRTLIASLDVAWKCRVFGQPEVEVSLRESTGRLLVNLLNRGANQSLTVTRFRPIIEEIQPTGRILVELRLENPPRAVRLEPKAQFVKWTYRDGWLKAEIESVPIHSILVIELLDV